MAKGHLTVLIKLAVSFAEHVKRTTSFPNTTYLIVQSFTTDFIEANREIGQDNKDL